MLYYETKDLTTVMAPAVILNGVNDRGVMLGSDLAKALYTKWPVVREDYLATSTGYSELGDVQYVRVGFGISVANCWTQGHYGRVPKKIYASTKAIRNCLEYVFWGISKFDPEATVYSPRLGCGLGGLNWEGCVKEVFEKSCRRYPEVKVVVCTI